MHSSSCLAVFGTLDEIFETAILIQAKKMKNFPVVIVGPVRPGVGAQTELDSETRGRSSLAKEGGT